MMKGIRSLYLQSGHKFYRNGLTFNEHSKISFELAKNEQQCSATLLASTFHNIGKMIHKDSTYRFTSGFLNMNMFPLNVSQIIHLQSHARHFLLCKNLFYQNHATPYMLKQLPDVTMTDNEIAYFQMQSLSKQAILVALNDVKTSYHRHEDLKVLTDEDWNDLEKIMNNVYQK